LIFVFYEWNQISIAFDQNNWNFLSGIKHLVRMIIDL
jgi:hypothetical protein